MMPLRRSPWLAGALLIVLAAGLVAPLAWWLGARNWALHVGLVAVALLLFGVVERLWQSAAGPWYRRAVERSHGADRGRFRVLTGGKRKGNGEDSDADEGQDGPRWVM